MEESQSIFEELCMSHLDAAFNLARLLVGRDEDAQDVVQEAYVRALKGFKGFRGNNARAWLRPERRLQLAQEACQTIVHGSV
jgi:DNA-directed RNA polymerase specialized sigma24 family protein